MKSCRPEIEWYEKGAGKNFVREYISQQCDWIEENYLKMPNLDDENCGIYGIYFNEKCIYIGESSEIARRWLKHIYHLNNDPINYWGIDLNEICSNTVVVKMLIIENGVFDEECRRKLEIKYIEKFNPILQRKIDKYYPNDKAEKKRDIWLQRDEVRPDQCINKKYRREIVKLILQI